MAIFERAKQDLYNKDVYMNNYLNYMFSKTNELFIYNNVPDSIDISKLEYFLQKKGFVFFTKDTDFHFYNGTLSDLDIYDEPRKINAIIEINDNPATKEYNLKTDGVLIKNDFLMLGLLPIFHKYGVMLNEAEITLYLHTITNRINYLISCTDDKTKKEADIFLNKIYKGDFSIIGSSAFFEGVEIKGVPSAMNSTKSDIELTQYIRASAFHEIGLNSNFNMKREQITATETVINERAIKPYIENMLSCRKEALEKINKMYGLNIEVNLSTIWDEITPLNNGGLTDEKTLSEEKEADNKDDITTEDKPKEDIKEGDNEN